MPDVSNADLSAVRVSAQCGKDGPFLPFVPPSSNDCFIDKAAVTSVRNLSFQNRRSRADLVRNALVESLQRWQGHEVMVIESNSLPNSCLLSVDPDTVLYRSFPLFIFERTLRLKQLVLVPPQMWEDPSETLPWRTFFEPELEPIPLSQFLWPSFAQCWTKTRESDTLIRAYSRVDIDPLEGRNRCPHLEGVIVKSTAGKLLAAIQSAVFSQEHLQCECYVGRVRYVHNDAFMQEIWEIIGKAVPQGLISPKAMAQLLLRKRTAFEHESEVRLICLERTGESSSEFKTIPIDPSGLFDEVIFDPRLRLFEYNERAKKAKQLGYMGSTSQSDLYNKNMLLISK